MPILFPAGKAPALLLLPDGEAPAPLLLLPDGEAPALVLLRALLLFLASDAPEELLLSAGGPDRSSFSLSIATIEEGWAGRHTTSATEVAKHAGVVLIWGQSSRSVTPRPAAA